MYINQYGQYGNNAVRTASSQGNSRTNQNNRTNENNSGMPDFSSALQNQRNEMMPQMQESEQTNGLQPVMPGRVPSMPPSGMPEMSDGKMPEMPEGEELPEVAEGEEPPAKPEGEDGDMPEQPDGNNTMNFMNR